LYAALLHLCAALFELSAAFSGSAARFGGFLMCRRLYLSCFSGNLF
jgi:hypothetical protein